MTKRRLFAPIGLAAMAVAAVTTAAGAHTPTSTGHTARTGAPSADARVVQPPTDVDPRMPVIKPTVPTRSRAIRPTTRPDRSGREVVPK